jgi:hypothetical protein
MAWGDDNGHAESVDDGNWLLLLLMMMMMMMVPPLLRLLLLLLTQLPPLPLFPPLLQQPPPPRAPPPPAAAGWVGHDTAALLPRHRHEFCDARNPQGGRAAGRRRRRCSWQPRGCCCGGAAVAAAGCYAVLGRKLADAPLERLGLQLWCARVLQGACAEMVRGWVVDQTGSVR